MNLQDTIAAIATPVGASGIGVIRISGPDALAIASKIFKSKAIDINSAATHTAHYGKLIDPVSGEHIDDVVLTIFRAPKSYTGEDTAEISCHGGIPILRAVLNAALSAGARLAEPGEFTKRAFLNGRIDLAQAEAVNDLIRAKTDQSRKLALSQLEGRLSSKLNEINNSLLSILAAIEASIDFPDDVPEPDYEWVSDELKGAQETVKSLLSTFDRGRVYREGLRVAIVGRVNVGKSSLLNALLRHRRAIVTPVPGTTRDIIEESLQIGGMPIVAVDTAGLRETDDPVEKLGIELTEQSAADANIILYVVDVSAGFSSADVELFNKFGKKAVILVLNKIDLLSEEARCLATEEYIQRLGRSLRIVQTCASSGQGIEELEDEIFKLAASSDAASESILVTNVRHKQLLESVLASINNALSTLNSNAPVDLLSVDIQAARNYLGLITGETASDDLVDRIFSEFCIGK